MKKWIALILALTMMFTLAACGGNDDAANGNKCQIFHKGVPQFFHSDPPIKKDPEYTLRARKAWSSSIQTILSVSELHRFGPKARGLSGKIRR